MWLVFHRHAGKGQERRRNSFTVDPVRIRPALLVGVVACAVTLVAPSPVALGESDPQLPAPTAGTDKPRVPPRWEHSSDGVRGEIASPLPAFMRFAHRTTSSKTWQSVPGVTVTSWDEATRAARSGPT